MSDPVLAALIGGIFTLLGVFLGRFLDRRWPTAQPAATPQTAPQVVMPIQTSPRPRATPAPVYTPAPKRRRRSGNFTINMLISGVLGTLCVLLVNGAESTGVPDPLIFVLLFGTILADAVIAGLLLNPNRSYMIPFFSALIFTGAMAGTLVFSDNGRLEDAVTVSAAYSSSHIIASFIIVTLRRLFGKPL